MPTWTKQKMQGLNRLLKNVYFVRSASLRACLRQIGVVYFQQLSGTDESRALTRLHAHRAFFSNL